ncbi:MAG: hypothetical protein JWM23_580 [Microbacteriaceae bacterium]|nr:hypothetical protein [Microbacteriaceae bacterium]
MSFSHSRIVKGRKVYSCDECGRRLEIGDRSVYTAAMWEGDFFTNRCCEHCNAFRKLIDKIDDGYYEAYYGGVASWVEDQLWREYEADVRELRAVAGFKMQWRTTAGNLLPVPEVSA